MSPAAAASSYLPMARRASVPAEEDCRAGCSRRPSGSRRTPCSRRVGGRTPILISNIRRCASSISAHLCATRRPKRTARELLAMVMAHSFVDRLRPSLARWRERGRVVQSRLRSRLAHRQFTTESADRRLSFGRRSLTITDGVVRGRRFTQLFALGLRRLRWMRHPVRGLWRHELNRKKKRGHVGSPRSGHGQSASAASAGSGCCSGSWSARRRSSP